MNKGVTKELQIRPVAVDKPQVKTKVQTFDQMLAKAHNILTDAIADRTGIATNSKRTVRLWSGEQLDAFLKDKHLVHSKRKMSGTDAEIRHACVKELLRQKFLVKTSWGDYKVAPEVMAQAS